MKTAGTRKLVFEVIDVKYKDGQLLVWDDRGGANVEEVYIRSGSMVGYNCTNLLNNLMENYEVSRGEAKAIAEMNDILRTAKNVGEYTLKTKF